MKTLSILIALLLNTTCIFAQNNTTSRFKNFTVDTIREVDKLRFLDSINKYRIEKGIAPVTYSFHDDKLAKFRVKTIFKHIDSINEQEYQKNPVYHLHYNFEKNVRSYENKYVPMDSVITRGGECSARYDKRLPVFDIVKDVFEGWKNSPEHWAQMMNPDFTYIVLAWYVDKRDYEKQKGTVVSLVLFNKLVVIKEGS